MRGSVGRLCLLVGVLALIAVGCGSSDDEGASSSGTSEAASASKPSFKTVSDGELTVAFADGLMPKISDDGKGGLQGFEGWLMTEVAKKYNLKIKPMPTTFSGAILAVQQNKADIGTSTYYSEERAKQVYYTVPNVNDLIGFLMPADAEYTGPDSLKGKKLGTQTGYLYNDVLNKYYGKSNVRTFPDLASVLAALKNGQIAAYVGGTGSGAALVKENPDLTINLLKEGEIGMPESMRKSAVYEYVNCGNKELAEAVNEVIKEKVESGELAEQLKPWNLDGEEFKPPLEPPAQGC